MSLLENKSALVTAAGQGIGFAIAKALSQAGASVTATDLNENALADLAADGMGTAVLDVTDDAMVSRIVGDAAPDILVNVAGVVHHGTVLDCTTEQWDQAMALNARSMFVCCKAALPAMIGRRDGCIINVASVASSLIGVPLRFAYSASKGAVLGLTKSIAADFIGQGVRVNAICPGTVRTPSWEGRVRDLAKADGVGEDEVRARFAARQPMGRVGEPGEIAGLAVYLASEAGSFATGQEFCIDGGWSFM